MTSRKSLIPEKNKSLWVHPQMFFSDRSEKNRFIYLLLTLPCSACYRHKKFDQCIPLKYLMLERMTSYLYYPSSRKGKRLPAFGPVRMPCSRRWQGCSGIRHQGHSRSYLPKRSPQGHRRCLLQKSIRRFVVPLHSFPTRMGTGNLQ